MKISTFNRSATSSRTTIILQSLFATMLSLAVFFVLGNNSASAATIPVTGSCTIAQAINSVNAGSNQGTCVGSGAYGTNDTINIPAGTHTLTADLPTITESVTIQGAGMGQTIVDGDGQYGVFNASDDNVELDIFELKVTGFLGWAILFEGPVLKVQNVDIDGSNAVPIGSGLVGIEIQGDSDFDGLVEINNVYIHNLRTATSGNGGVSGLSISQNGLRATNVILSSITISELENTLGDTQAFMIGVIGGGVVSTVATNVTIDDIRANGAALGFGILGLANAGDAEISVDVRSTSIRGVSGLGLGEFGQSSMAFYTGGGADGIYKANVQVNVENSLLVNNQHDGIPSNCGFFDLNSVFGYTGVVISLVNSKGYNMSDDASCTSFTEPTDQQNVPNILPTLGPLQNNGGAVPTMALLPGSPAISAGGAVLGVTTDARGVARPSSNTSVGAYQYVLGDETETPTGGNSQNGAGQLSETGANSMSTIVLAFIILISSIMMIQKQRREY
jgi:hypothetical protein